MSEFHTVARVGEIPEGEARTFVVEDCVVAVFNQRGTYRAINDTCPHMGASLATGYLEGDAVTCPWHAWRFSVENGCWLDYPESKLRVDSYRVRIQGEEIQVCVNPPADE